MSPHAERNRKEVKLAAEFWDESNMIGLDGEHEKDRTWADQAQGAKGGSTEISAYTARNKKNNKNHRKRFTALVDGDTDGVRNWDVKKAAYGQHQYIVDPILNDPRLIHYNIKEFFSTSLTFTGSLFHSWTIWLRFAMYLLLVLAIFLVLWFTRNGAQDKDDRCGGLPADTGADVGNYITFVAMWHSNFTNGLLGGFGAMLQNLGNLGGYLDFSTQTFYQYFANRIYDKDADGNWVVDKEKEAMMDGCVITLGRYCELAHRLLLSSSIRCKSGQDLEREVGHLVTRREMEQLHTVRHGSKAQMVLGWMEQEMDQLWTFFKLPANWQGIHIGAFAKARNQLAAIELSANSQIYWPVWHFGAFSLVLCLIIFGYDQAYKLLVVIAQDHCPISKFDQTIRYVSWTINVTCWPLFIFVLFELELFLTDAFDGYSDIPIAIRGHKCRANKAAQWINAKVRASAGPVEERYWANAQPAAVEDAA